MYVKANIQLHVNGQTEDFQVGADVTAYSGGNGFASGHDVGECEVSAPGLTLNQAMLADVTELPEGWSREAEEALALEYDMRLDAADEDYGDFLRDARRDEDPEEDYR